VAAALTLAWADGLAEATAALPVLLAALDDVVEDVTEDYTALLNAMGKSAVPAIVERLRDRDPAVRAVAVRTLSRMGTSRSGFPPELKDRVQERVRAVRAAMRSALGDGDESIRSAASEVFRALGVEAVPDLIAALDDPSATIRHRVARTLGGMGNDARTAIGPLRKLRDDADPNVRQAAETAALAIEQTYHFDSVSVPLQR
jgi:HEAT repeat protein